MPFMKTTKFDQMGTIVTIASFKMTKNQSDWA